MTVQEAMGEAKRVARVHCPRCGDGPIPVLAARAGTPHTCEADITAARDVALAAFDAGVYAKGHFRPADIALKRNQIAGLT